MNREFSSAQMMTQLYPKRKRVFLSTAKKTEGNARMKHVLGGKGANIAEMNKLGIPVPPAFTIDSRTNLEFLIARSMRATGQPHLTPDRLPPIVMDEVMAALKEIEAETGKLFGDGDNPLLVSVRSGAAESMPGMMDTVLNLGLNDQTLNGLIAKTNDERFAFDNYRRFIQMFGNVVLEIKNDKFDRVINAVKESKGSRAIVDTDLSADDWKRVVDEFRNLVATETGAPFPQDVNDQLQQAIAAVFRSWNNDRAIQYRRIHRITEEMANGTAVNIQAMVFGNTGPRSGTGVVFTRNPNSGEIMVDASGERIFYGDFLLNAQGEDVVAGIRTPMDITELKAVMPAVYQQLSDTLVLLEKHYCDMQDVEFTIEDGKLWILQTRSGKRTIRAAIRTAIDATLEFGITQAAALQRVPSSEITQLLLPTFERNEKGEALDENGHVVPVIARGTPASIGAAVGRAVFTARDAIELHREAREIKEKDPASDADKLILITPETSPDDIGGMEVSQGIGTFIGGKTSHAAVVSRQMQRPAVVSMKPLEKGQEDQWRFDLEKGVLTMGTRRINRLDWISLDGTTGEIMLGKMPTKAPELDEHFHTLMQWTDQFRALGIKANAEEETVVLRAVQYGAEGIGLARTEHMFFHNVVLFQTMLLADSVEIRAAALEKLLAIQKDDFKMIFKHMGGKSVTIRLLDPPLHEFLPTRQADRQRIADALGKPVEAITELTEKMRESNPMLGTRGVRLLLSRPEIPIMQSKAIIRAATECRDAGIDVKPEIMVPLISDVEELIAIKRIIDPVIDETLTLAGVTRADLGLKIGTMIELPSVATKIMAAAVAREADFASFGTNDLTQTVLGLSRDDTAAYITHCLENGIYTRDPFETLHPSVREMIEQCVIAMKQANPDIVIGICGEHGGDPQSIDFLNGILVDITEKGIGKTVRGLDYVSMSSPRIPCGRIAAAQAELKFKRK
ncbi:MAG: pyruvate, phosphate dikinase [Thermodesulfobacteriota bacterium]